MFRRIALILALASSIQATAFFSQCPPTDCCDWTGLYIGGYLGGAWDGRVTSQETGLTPGGGFYNEPDPWSYDLDSSWIGGGTIGYNYQICSWVIGIENEIGYLRLKGGAVDPNSADVGFDTRTHSKIGDWYDVLALRLGYSYRCFLLYAKGGAAFTKLSGAVIDDSSAVGRGLIHATGHKNVTTWAVGGGLEYALCRNWSLKAEYLYLDLGEKLHVSGPILNVPAFTGITANWDHTFRGIHTAKFGINYRFSLGCGCF